MTGVALSGRGPSDRERMDHARLRPAATQRSAQESLELARAIFAASLRRRSVTRTLGSITLRSDQVDSVHRVRASLAAHGGCLLADEVGVGKTFVALAAAREWSQPLVIVPASLRRTWSQALDRAGIRAAIVSHESLSRGVEPDASFDGIIVDESHRFRSTARRHGALARLVARAPVILLSATPLQNRVSELAGQLALYLGELAYQLDSRALATYVVRGGASRMAPLPRVAPPRWLQVDCDDGEVLRAILALPPPPRASDAGDGGALLLISLVRAWASSRAALLATLRRRRRTLIALEQCLTEGRIPTRGELRSWRGEDGVQLGFVSLLAAAGADAGLAATVNRSITRENVALDHLWDLVSRGPDPDQARAMAIRGVQASHSGASILAFSESASTIRALHSALRGDAGVGMLTANEARIASGRIPRDELLARFAPRAQGAREVAEHDRVRLLLATDLLSEGVNLQDASVVIHLDLPWNPARLSQRLGRLRRPGGAPEVAAYLMTPPARSALLLRSEARLRAKLDAARRTVGFGLDVLPALTVDTAAEIVASRSTPGTGGTMHPMSDAELRGEIDLRLAAWSAGDPEASERLERSAEAIVIAAVHSPISGWVAALDDGRLLAHLSHPGDHEGENSACDHPSTIARALELAGGAWRAPSAIESRRAHRMLTSTLDREWTMRSCGAAGIVPPMRRLMLKRLAEVVRTAPRHRRAVVLATAGRLRAALERPLPLGLERALVSASESGEAGDVSWIERALELIEPHREGASCLASPTRLRPHVRAVILLGPTDGL